MRALFEAIMTGDGRLVSQHQEFTFCGQKLIEVELVVGPDEQGDDEGDDDEREAA